MRENKLVCTCDICKKEVADEKELFVIEIPVRGRSGDGYPVYKEFYDADLCETCKDKFWESSIKNFADVTLSSNRPSKIDEVKLPEEIDLDDSQDTNIEDQLPNPDLDPDTQVNPDGI